MSTPEGPMPASAYFPTSWDGYMRPDLAFRDAEGCGW